MSPIYPFQTKDEQKSPLPISSSLAFFYGPAESARRPEMCCAVLCCVLGVTQGITNQQPLHAPCMSTLKLRPGWLAHCRWSMLHASNPRQMTNGSRFAESVLFAAWLQMCCISERRSNRSATGTAEARGAHCFPKCASIGTQEAWLTPNQVNSY